VEDVGQIVRDLESRGVRFRLDHPLVGFEYDWRQLEPGDPMKLGELIFERESEVRRFLERRAAGPMFGAYAGIFRAAIQDLHTPAGMFVWLRESCPSLYRDLTTRLPDRIQSLWEQGAPIESFEAAVGRLAESHRAARGFYDACRKGKQVSE
jgi:hypothetical protein